MSKPFQNADFLKTPPFDGEEINQGDMQEEKDISI